MAREYEATSEAFAEEVADYRAAMRSVVADLRSGYLEPSAGEALAALRAAGGEPGAAATAALPRPPVAPVLHGRISDFVGREAAPAPPAASALPPGRARAKGEEIEPGGGAGGEGGQRSGRAPSPPRVLVVGGFEGQETVTIQRLEDAEFAARAGSGPVCDDAGVATGGLPPDAPGRGAAPEARRRPAAGAAREGRMSPRAALTIMVRGGKGIGQRCCLFCAYNYCACMQREFIFRPCMLPLRRWRRSGCKAGFPTRINTAILRGESKCCIADRSIRRLCRCTAQQIISRERNPA